MKKIQPTFYVVLLTTTLFVVSCSNPNNGGNSSSSKHGKDTIHVKAGDIQDHNSIIPTKSKKMEFVYKNGVSAEAQSKIEIIDFDRLQCKDLVINFCEGKWGTPYSYPGLTNNGWKCVVQYGTPNGSTSGFQQEDIDFIPDANPPITTELKERDAKGLLKSLQATFKIISKNSGNAIRAFNYDGNQIIIPFSPGCKVVWYTGSHVFDTRNGKDKYFAKLLKPTDSVKVSVFTR